MLTQQQRHQRGDTLVETVLSMAILTMVLLTSWSLVTRATQVSLNSRKRIEMVNRLKEQAEVIKGQYTNDKSQITTRKMGGAATILNAVTISSDPCDDSRSGTPDKAFYMAVDETAGTIGPNTGVKITNTTEKVWVQLVNQSDYVDFYVRGCWQSFGAQKDENSQLRVRLNK